jgi:hypothetical protein
MVTELQERRTSLLDQIARQAKAGTMCDDDMLNAINELNDINESFFILSEPWEQADTDMQHAVGRARSVLEDCGYKPLPDES